MFKQLWSTIPPIPTNQVMTSNLTEHRKDHDLCHMMLEIRVLA